MHITVKHDLFLLKTVRYDIWATCIIKRNKLNVESNATFFISLNMIRMK